MSHLGDVQSLNLSHTNVDDATGLGDIYDLNLNYTNVADVSMLGGVSILHLQGTPIQDVSSLGIVTVLDISETNIIDIEALSRVIAIRTHIDIISPSWWKGEEVDLINTDIHVRIRTDKGKGAHIFVNTHDQHCTEIE